jgi:hypothetical protein
MNREIKFRQPVAQGKQIVGWHYWGFIDGCFIAPAGPFKNYTTGTGGSQQFSGLLDKNGKEIYEGDIITYDLKEGLGEPARIGLQSEVKYSPLGFFGAWDTNIKVIGNRFENPELLTK